MTMTKTVVFISRYREFALGGSEYGGAMTNHFRVGKGKVVFGG